MLGREVEGRGFDRPRDNGLHETADRKLPAASLVRIVAGEASNQTAE